MSLLVRRVKVGSTLLLQSPAKPREAVDPQPKPEAVVDAVRTRPTLEMRRGAAARHTIETGANLRARQLQQSLGPPEIQAARERYQAWSDPEALREQLRAKPDLSKYSEAELNTLAALSIDRPEVRSEIALAVRSTVESAAAIRDLPRSGAFQYLLEEHVLDARGEEGRGALAARSHLSELVDREAEDRFEAAVDGKRGDGELEEAIGGYLDGLADLARDQPSLAPLLDCAFERTIEENGERIQDIRRADDRWWQDVNHAITGGLRGAADWVADRFFVDTPPGANQSFGSGPISRFLNSELGRNLSDLGGAIGDSGRESITSPVQALTDPRGTARAAIEIVRHPSLLLESYREVAERRGLSGAAGAIGFDVLMAVASSGAAAEGSLAAESGGLRRIVELPKELGALESRASIGARLLERESFRALDESVQTLAIERAERLFERAGARESDVIEELVNSPAFAALDDGPQGVAEQRRLLQMIGSSEPMIGDPARDEVRRLLDGWKQEGATSPYTQADQLQRLVLGQNTTREVVPGPGAYPPRVGYAMHLPETTTHAFASGTAEATRSIVGIDGRTIEIIAPANVQAVSPNDIADAIAALPAEGRNRIKRIVLEPDAQPIAWLTGDEGAEATALATADVDGTIRVYPALLGANHEQLTDTLAHEVGHLTSFEELGTPRHEWSGRSPFTYESEGWERWKHAVEHDGVRPARYASTDLGEDFAETYRVYLGSRGTPWHAELRALMPERFAILDEIIAGGGS